jgi:protein MpaA
VQRLGRNINGYFGETLDIGAVLADCLVAAQTHGWTMEQIHPEPRSIVGFVRKSSSDSSRSPRVYISTGIHGDEPAGPLAARQLLQENQWPAGLDLWFCPCLNPSGFPLNRRENAEGVDLNRDYLNPKTAEVGAHITWLQRQPAFDLSFCLHEDWESQGFYVYELNPNHLPSMAEVIVARVAEVCPVDPSDIIEGRPAKSGIIRPEFDPRSRPLWAEAFFLITYKSPRSYTLEAPSDFPLSVRVAALVAGVRGSLEEFVRS